MTPAATALSIARSAICLNADGIGDGFKGCDDVSVDANTGWNIGAGGTIGVNPAGVEENIGCSR